MDQNGLEGGWKSLTHLLGCLAAFLWGSLSLTSISPGASLWLRLLPPWHPEPPNGLLELNWRSARFESRGDIRPKSRGTWVAQSVKHLTLDFSSGHDLGVLGSNPASSSAHSLLEILSLPLLPLVCSLFLSLSNKEINTIFWGEKKNDCKEMEPAQDIDKCQGRNISQDTSPEKCAPMSRLLTECRTM